MRQENNKSPFIKIVREFCPMCSDFTEQIAQKEDFGYSALCRRGKHKVSGTKLF